MLDQVRVIRYVTPHREGGSLPGIVEADDADHERILGIMEPYLGSMVGVYSDWTPLDGRSGLFPEDVDATDPWQFRNVIVR